MKGKVSMLDKERRVLEARIDVFLQHLQTLFYPQTVELSATFGACAEDIDFAARLSVVQHPVSKGQEWGENFQTGWFHLVGVVPAEWRGKPVYGRLNIGGEGLVYSASGEPLASISMHSVWQPGFKRDRFLVIESAHGGETVDLWIEATAAQLFGLQLQRDPALQNPQRFGHYRPAIQDLSLALFREDVWRLHNDCRLLDRLMRSLSDRSVRRARILQALMQSIDRFNETDQGVECARKALQPELQKPASASDLHTTAVGHAHLDTAWLWPLGETVRKCGRTFLTQAMLLEKYPDYVFGASMPQHYVFCQQRYPAVYERVKKLVAKGRWEPQGGMWVEADCNLIGGESMVRQILHGKGFFRDEFGIDVRHLWLPDVFGYSANLPQILKKSGITTMVTQKLCWNRFNRFPHHAFNWRGIDGSEVVVHFPPEDTYNSELSPAALRYAQENFEERAVLDEFLTLFGIGDGGGGPTEEMIETGLKLHDLEACPQVRFGPAQPFLDRLAEHKEKLKTWTGELYFELHRGTLTTQAFNKKMNRRLELRLRELEVLFSGLPLADYPQSDLDRLWKSLLLLQFHDILPGSSIGQVYADCRIAYAGMEKQADRLLQRAEAAWVEPAQDSLALVNTLSTPYCRPLLLPEEWRGFAVTDEDDNSIAVQDSETGALVQIDIPALAIKTIKKGVRRLQKEETNEGLVLENELIRYEFGSDGTISSAYDKEAEFEVLRGQGGNVISLYEDRPTDWDAWEIEHYYENQLLEQAKTVHHSAGSAGPISRSLGFEFRIAGSFIHQQIVLSANSKRLDFVTQVDWQERHKMLRVAFETCLHADQAVYEIQYGAIVRPTHRNTSWDAARFEVAGHRWADLSERDYGVALLNNCKYGHKITSSTIDLNLLRATTNPDPEADRGSHEFIYSLLPHIGDLADSGVVAEAAQLNQPVVVFRGRARQSNLLPVRLLGDGVVLEVAKKAEKNNDLILRFYECRGRRAKAKLLVQQADVHLFTTSLLEEGEKAVEIIDGCAALEFTPFEIKTFRLQAI